MNLYDLENKYLGVELHVSTIKQVEADKSLIFDSVEARGFITKDDHEMLSFLDNIRSQVVRKILNNP